MCLRSSRTGCCCVIKFKGGGGEIKRNWKRESFEETSIVLNLPVSEDLNDSLGGWRCLCLLLSFDIKAPTAAQQRPSCRRRYRLELVVGFGQ